MKVLLTGAGGQVGREVQRAGWPSGTDLIAHSHESLDIGNGSEVTEKIAGPLDVAINLAAYTAVDRAESERDRATRVNAEGSAILARRCAVLGVPLIHLSTDYIFDGAQNSPYTENQAPNPVNHYGVSKLQGEDAVRNSLREHVIIRTASVFSEFGSNFVKAMLRLGSERESLDIVSDQWSCPTAAADIAAAIVRIVRCIMDGREPKIWGTYHFCGQPAVTWFGFAEEIFKVSAECGEATPRLHAIRADEYPGAARRPRYCAMDTAKIERTFGIEASSWAARLPQVVAAILKRRASE